ncbi:hypothetical protein QE410_000396 [Microbacterium sp. SORGH_AS 1204]|uniref:hypothetical protein n=1 Tax=Microbacterium sp. SORGH_AS_1204 TaxID=3041785 RepID=UPI0027903062|nr:hypothetical protein [Microbacterium sp. SORGH_AS_1204]MDQ1135597.1 hypothetical protein [Microbacterium sp. SORGH_AS_1204]
MLAAFVAWRIVAARRRKAAHARELAGAVAAARAESAPATEAEPVPAGGVVTDSPDTATRASRRDP